jgi:hypothetical protein
LDADEAARERRIEHAVRMLREAPARRSAFVAGRECNGSVPVTVVIRTDQGLVNGDLAIAKERWDPLLFLQFIKDQDEKTSA